jgi:glycosyltransferase involved in cell wall biosynthesis
MKILLINHYAGSKKHGMEYRPFYLAREWVKLGHDVRIVAASFTHLRTQAPTLTGEFTQEEIEGIQYIWLRTPGYQGNNLGRVFNILTFVFQLLRYQSKLLENFKPDVVIASSTYPLDIYPAYQIAKRTYAKLIFEVHDLWPLTPIELAGMLPWHPYIMLLQQAENFAYQKADRIVSMLPKADSYMRSHGMAAHKFTYLPNSIDVEEWENSLAPLPPLHSETLAQLKQLGHFLVCYAGSHGLANALYTLVDAAQLLQKEPVTFILVGQGAEKESLLQKAQQLELKNIVFLPPVSRASLPALLSQMDALFIGLKSQSLFRFGVSPNKLIDYMMAAKPVIHAIEAGNDLVAESGCGISIPAENPGAIARVVKQLMQMTVNDRELIGKKGREYVLKYHDCKVIARQFIEVVQLDET